MARRPQIQGVVIVMRSHSKLAMYKTVTIPLASWLMVLGMAVSVTWISRPTLLGYLKRVALFNVLNI
jgi:hypothetical protein